MSLKKTSIKTLKLLRPKQWIKNFAVFAAIIFTGQLFNFPVLWNVCLGFLVFCAVSSSIYVVNDIFDVEKDRLHPFKRFRPLANKDLSVSYAIVVCAVLIAASLLISLFINIPFFFLVLIYLFLQLLYSAVLKHLPVLDILTLAAGYMLRVYAGELTSTYHISIWLVLTTVALSLFLAVGKRKSELTLIANFSESQIQATRKTLSHYSEQLLNVYISIFATSTFVFYSFFTFLENPKGLRIGLDVLMPDFLPAFFQRKWLMLTIVPVVFGIMRYLQDIYEKHEGESPERVFLTDTPLLVSVVVWIILVIGIIYLIGG
ncbi:MAG: decaprenyl-phosphate phosphoribosyltransferase [Candidatus Levyibacteriota bacterium]